MDRDENLSMIANEIFEFQGTIDSEMREMLSVILPAVKLAQKSRLTDEKDIEKTKMYLKIVSRASYNMLRTLNNAADYMALRQKTLEPEISACDIVALCRELVLTVSETVAGKNISFSLLTDSESKYITCDCEKTERIILNILSNAIANTGQSGSILLCLKDNADFWELTVTDNGPSPDTQFQKQLLEEFSMRESASRRRLCGIGMGLYLSHEFARLQGGSLSLSSRGSKGCIFVLTMPSDASELSSLRESVIPEYTGYSFEQKVDIELSYLEETCFSKPPPATFSQG